MKTELKLKIRNYFSVFSICLATAIYILFRFTSQVPTLGAEKEKLKQQIFAISQSEPLRTGAFSPLPKHTSANPEKARLGKMLFEDKRLSKDDSLSCASCHDLYHGGANSLKTAVGIRGQIGEVNTPTVFNSQFNFRQFWDGRAASLNEQIEGPIHSPIEMATSWTEILAKLEQDKRVIEEFDKIYPKGLHRESVIDAIVEFEKSLITPNSAFDQFLRGDASALSARQLAGYQKFDTLGCVACHQGRNIGGNMFQSLGIAGDYFKARGGFLNSDLGRYNVTKREQDKYVFRVPSLRNVELTAPYFHDGAVPTLEEAVRKMAKYQLGRNLVAEDVEDIVEFLKALTGQLPVSLQSVRGTANEAQ